MTIAEFIAARLDEDEQVARTASEGQFAQWAYESNPDGEVYAPNVHASDGYPHYITQDGEGIVPTVERRQGIHIARHDPARALRDVAGKRRILALATEIARSGAEFADQDFATLTRALAEPYADHPDYRQEWST